MNKPKPILVTGSHRSGSTWIGKVIATSPSVDYIHEPFNGMCRPGKCSVQFPYTYMYVTENNELNFYPGFKDTVSFQYNIGSELKVCKTPRDIARLIRDYLNFSQNQVSGITPLIKDPMAIFSAEWLSQRFDMNILISIRHPAAFVSSCKQLGWSFNFQNFLDQPLLIEDYLQPFKDEIEYQATTENENLIDKLCLLWKIIYHTVNCYQNKYPNWLFLKYEDICENPMEMYQNIFDEFQIKFSEKTKNMILESTNYNQYKGVLQEIHSVKRNSKKNINIWQERLTAKEIATIKSKVKDVSQYFYTDNDWICPQPLEFQYT